MERQARKLIVSEWMSLDGVFDAETMDAWWNPYHSDERGQEIKSWIDGAGAILIGRVTYQMLAAYWPNLKNNEMGIAGRMNSLPKHVASTTLKTAAGWNNTSIMPGNVMERVAELKRQPGQDILVFGSAALVRTLAAADLIDEYRFLVQPIVMGRGKRVFEAGAPTTKLRLAEARTLPQGVLALSYRRAEETK